MAHAYLGSQEASAAASRACVSTSVRHDAVENVWSAPATSCRSMFVIEQRAPSAADRAYSRNLGAKIAFAEVDQHRSGERSQSGHPTERQRRPSSGSYAFARGRESLRWILWFATSTGPGRASSASP
jgi:hypothetical protein